jgi:hypothetical protein
LTRVAGVCMMCTPFLSYHALVAERWVRSVGKAEVQGAASFSYYKG